ncbi:MAG: bifunctional DNA-formamidopyrimidine glycosylase/DNA-(apurinic or apyrimidinic site) lyase [Candidatus Solibacter usitatus]|nr:bifunctional DNA-formamidopyrimidine glycosylase/DNA-(apurinic or apyrimidinic site) lyase [Candidatus Solibacter usitatus]
MPELPEVEAVCRKLRAEARGLRMERVCVERPGIIRPQKRARFERELTGARIEDVVRRAKNILLMIGEGRALHVHLRMTGNLFVVPDARLRPAATRVWMELEGGSGLIFEDQRALGTMRLLSAAGVRALMDACGCEPLSAEFTKERFAALAAASRQPAKLFLMDQRHVAGLGNIYAAEALFRARIHPRHPMNRLTRAKLHGLREAIVDVLTEGLISAELAYSKPGRFTEGEEFACAVYDREGEPCVNCAARIRRIPQGGRSTYFCPRCQRQTAR